MASLDKSRKPYSGKYETVVPEVQQKLQSSLESSFSGKLITLPPLAGPYGLAYGVTVEHAAEVFATLKNDQKFSMAMLANVTAVDWLDRREPRYDVVYQLLSLIHLHRLCIKIQVGEENPEVESVRSLWPSANFMEREVFDMYGITFRNHGDLRRILMYPEFEGFPLRKDYPLRGKQPRVPLRVPELRNTSEDMIRDELVSLPSRKGGTSHAS